MVVLPPYRVAMKLTLWNRTRIRIAQLFGVISRRPRRRNEFAEHFKMCPSCGTERSLWRDNYRQALLPPHKNAQPKVEFLCSACGFGFLADLSLREQHAHTLRNLKIRQRNPYRCPSGKVKYNTLETATLNARELLESKGRLLRPYRCRRCKGYHLTRTANPLVEVHGPMAGLVQ